MQESAEKPQFYIAVVKFINTYQYAHPRRRGKMTWRAEMVGLGGRRIPCRTPNHNPGGYHCEEYARHDANGYAELTGWPILLEDEARDTMLAWADSLDALQAPENDGRGVSAVRSVIAELRRGDMDGASAVANNDWDKICSYRDIADAIKNFFLVEASACVA